MYKDNLNFLEWEVAEDHLSLDVFDLYLDFVEQQLKNIMPN